MSTRKWSARVIFGLAVSVCMVAPYASSPTPAVALNLDPFEYYDVDYHIVFSDDEVEPGEQFSVTVGVEVRCTQDMPFGANEAVVVVSGEAHHTANGAGITLLDDFEVVVPDVPDWQGDSYSMEETVDLAFPADATEGTYDIVAVLEHVSIDGWNITGLIPGSYKNIPVGPITVATPEAEPSPPPSTPGVLNVAVLGHNYSPEIDDDGVVAETVSATLIEGEVSLLLQKGTTCLDSSGNPLEYISMVHKASPRPYSGGIVLAAYSLHPNGATFDPSLSLAIRFDESGLPAGTDAEDLTLAYYEDDSWTPLPGTPGEDGSSVKAEIGHFSTVGLLAPTDAPSPAAFVVQGLEVTPSTVSPMDNVYVTFSVRNAGGTSGTYPLMVEVNGASEYARELTLAPSAVQNVRFQLARSTPGTYAVAVGDKSASFSVASRDSASGPGDSNGEGATEDTQSSGPDSGPEAPDGMNPVYTALLVMMGVAFLTLVILLLAGVL